VAASPRVARAARRVIGFEPVAPLLPGGDPYPRPRLGAPLRLAFVGQSTYFGVCALEERSARVSTAFVEFRAGGDADAMRARLDELAPHAVVVFRPEILPAGALADVRAPVIGFLTEPLPRRRSRAHIDLRRRRFALSSTDVENVDRLVAFDPLIVPAADEVMPVWRALPLPVADRLFGVMSPRSGRPSILFLGRSTEHREGYLERAKAELDVVHAAHGIGPDDVTALLGAHQIGGNLHNEPYPSFENRVCLHLAAGQLVVSETLSPTHGLEPGIDYLEVATPAELLAVLRAAVAYPAAYERVRVRGRRKAEAFRASRVYPRLIADLWADLRVFGTHRAAAS
jgi:hypothetical protein